MHIPDNFLNTPALAVTGAASLGLLAVGIWRTRNVPPERIPLMGITGAFVFAVQLIHFPLGLTSIHLSAALLAGILLGPFSGLLIVSTALILHSFFGHGGVLSLGANIFNMGIIGCVLCYIIYRILPKTAYIGAAVAAWLSIVLAALACGVELWISGKLPEQMDKTTFWVLAGIVTGYMITGLIEAVVTIIILNAVKRIRPDLLEIKKI
jgi:cobalt/nickel transport system permease protein